MFSDTDCDIRSGLTLPAARLTVAKRKAGLSLWTNAKALPTNVNFQKAKEYVSLLVFLGFLCIRGGNHLFFESTSFLYHFAIAEYNLYLLLFIQIYNFEPTVFENHRNSLIQYCERSELRLHFEWTRID